MDMISDGIRLAYDIAGRGPVLVLIHGFGLDRTIWDEVFGALSGRCRVIRVDLRGCGESGAGSGPALMETLAGDLFGLLEALDVERAILAGHSLGGYVALAYFRMYAERVAGLALIASRVDADDAQTRAERDRLAAAVAAHGMAAAAATYLPPAPATPAAERARAVMLAGSAAGAVALIAGMKERLDSSDLLSDIHVPVSLVAGEDDDAFASAQLAATARAIADCTVVPIPNAGRLPMLESPTAITAALAALVERCGVHPSAA